MDSTQIQDLTIDEVDDAHVIVEIDENSDEEFEENEDGVGDDGGSICMDNNNINYHTPYVGLEYMHSNDAYDSYNLYAKANGFGIRKSSTSKSTRTGDIIGRLYVCSKQGITKSPNGEDGINSKKRRSSRSGCLAKMWIHLNDSRNAWKVTMFNDTHNHNLVSPSKVIKFRSHRTSHKTTAVKNLMVGLHSKGMRVSAISKVANILVGDSEKNITPQQCHDHLRTLRKNNMRQECVGIINHFQAQMGIDPLFYFTIQVAKDHSVRSIFLADGRSITSYLEFGDVVSFDVTYRTNKFNLPFAPFTGVNHHRQSTLFGCALLADETEDTFIWLFEQWLKCMCGKAPGAIITDQDPAICAAIKQVFPRTRHRYCSWHVGKHTMEHLHEFRSSNEKFLSDWNSWFYSRTIVDSENQWEVLKIKYNLASYSWVMNMYNLRHHWVPIYLSDTFTAGNTSTQRSESINSFFDNYVNAVTPLDDFVKQYENALAARRQAENEEDFKTLNTKPHLESMLEIEAQAARCYTRKIFNIFQAEFKKSGSYLREKIQKDAGVIKYKIGLRTCPKESWRTVIYDIRDGVKLICSCSMFETEAENSFLECNDTTSKEVSALMVFSLKAKMNKLLEEASFLLTLYKEIDALVGTKLMEIMRAKESATPDDANISLELVVSGALVGNSNITVYDPPRPVTTKGRPSNATRIKSGKEVTQQLKDKQKRHYKECKREGHYSSTCPELKNKG